MSKKSHLTHLKRGRFEIRATEQTLQRLEDCARKLNGTKTDVVMKGLELVEKELNK